MHLLKELWSKKTIKSIALALIFGLPVFSYGMEFLEGEIAGTLERELAGEFRTVFEDSLEGAMGVKFEEIGKLGELDTQLAERLKSTLSDIAKEFNGTPESAESVGKQIKEAIINDRQNFIKSVNDVKAFDPEAHSVVEKIKGFNEEYAAMQPSAELQPKYNLLTPGVKRGPGDIGLRIEAEVEIAEGELGIKVAEFYSADETGDPVKIEEAMRNLKDAEDLLQAKKVAQTKFRIDEFKQAQDKAFAAQESVLTDGVSGNGNSIANAETNVVQTEAEVEAVEAEKNIDAARSNRDDYHYKKDEYKLQKERVKARKQQIEDIDKQLQDIDKKLAADPENQDLIAQKEKLTQSKADWEQKLKNEEAAYDVANKAYNDAYKKYVEEGDWFSSAGKWKALENIIIPGVKWAGKKIGELIGTGIQSILFVLPGWAMQAWTQYSTKETLLNNLRASQTFGGISMYILDGIINKADPINSHFVYVGNKKSEPPVTDQEKPYRNYYVSINPETGAVAEVPVFSENCTMMLHLNSGLVFAGDGEPVNQKSPTLQLLGNQVADEFKTEGGPFSFITLQEALNEAASKLGPLSGSVQAWYQWKDASGFPGEPIVADLMRSGNDQKIPKLLTKLVSSLQAGGFFGNMNVQGIRALGQQELDFLTSIVTHCDDCKLLPLNKVPDIYDYPIADGTYIYQTQDTPFIQMMLQQIKAEDPNKQIQQNALNDYVIFVQDPNNPVPLPLYIPSINDGQAPTWGINPNAQYMISLVEPAITEVDLDGKIHHMLNMYDIHGQMYMSSLDESDAVAKAVAAMKNGPAWLEQINLVKAYFAERAENGPFNYGNYTLVIDPEFARKDIPIYQVKGVLEGGSDDYLVSLLDTHKGRSPLMLPRRVYMETEAGKQVFVSLVTSRFYTTAQSSSDSNSAMIIPDTTEIPYWVVTKNGVATLTTEPQSSAQTGSAPLYTLFVDEAFNPTVLPPDIKRLPTGSQWAINNIQINDPENHDTTPKLITVAELFANYGGDAGIKNLQDGIQASYAAWKSYNNDTYPVDIDRQMGPLTWIDGLEPHVFMATSPTEIKNNIFVYKSAEYPDEYLVMSANKTGIKGTPAFDEANPQPYAISLSTGNVYERASDGAKVANLNVASLLQASGISASAAVYAEIQQSQAIALAKIRQNLYGPAIQFGAYQLYVRASDYLNGQFIYADVSGLGDPLNPGTVTENNAVVSKIIDYFVCMEQVPQKDSKGNPVIVDGQIQYVPDQYTFGTQLGANTYAIVSLVTGAAFTRGSYFASYRDLNVSAKDPLNFAQIILKTFIPQPIDSTLYNRIQTLTKQEYDKYLKELEEITKEREEEQKLKQDLSQNILLNLTQAKYVPDNPNNPPRYLVQYSASPAKYYMVTPVPDLKKDPLAAPQIIIDYNYNPAGEPKDTGVGIVYQVETKDGSTRGVFQVALQGTMLALIRAHSGVVVQQDGSEKLVMPALNPSIPMKFVRDGKVLSALEDTGITKQMTDSIKQVFNFKFWYNMLTQSYLAQVTRPDGISFYIDATSGLCFDWDGTSETASLRLNQSPLYKGNATEDYLFIGQDEFNVLKVAFRNPDKPENGYEPYSLIWKVDPQGDITFGSVRTANGTLNFNNFQGSQFVLNNDFNAQEINLGYVYKDPAGNPLPSAQNNIQPFYAVWTRDDDNHFFFKDKYDIVPDLNYSLLMYQQTRAVGQPIENGSYVDSDNLHYVCIEPNTDPDAEDPFTIVPADKPCSAQGTKAGLMKVLGVIFDKNRTFKKLYYNGILVDLSAPSKTADGVVYSGSYTITNPDKSKTQHAIKVTIADYTFPNTPITTPIISITDGQKVYDYSYDYHIVNNSPIKDPKDINLYSLMRDTWKLKVTSFIPNKYMQSTKKVVDGKTTWEPNSPTGTYATTALAGSLSIGSKPSPIVCPEGSVGCDPNILAQALKSITVYTDTNEKTIYIPNTSIPGKKFKRFLYKLGANQWDQGKSYYPMTSVGTSFLNGYSVDLATGILYYPQASGVGMYPVGISLLPSQLDELLNTLDLAIHLDADGYPDGLQYRSIATLDDGPNSLAKLRKKALMAKKLKSVKKPVGIKPLIQPVVQSKKMPQKKMVKPLPVQKMRVPAQNLRPANVPAQLQGRPTNRPAQIAPRVAVPQTRPLKFKIN